MKALFLIFHGFEEYNGISKKILYQIQALKDLGIKTYTCYYDVTDDNYSKWFIDENELLNLGKGTFAKIKKRIYYKHITDFVQNEKIDIIYIRSYHNANPFTIHFVKSLKKKGAKVVMEIPTYPYDQEYITRAMKNHLAIDRIFRNRLSRVTDAIVTFSNEPFIFGQRTICISNGINFSAIKMKEKKNDTTPNALHLIGVAEVHFWHGFDRIIEGMARYYNEKQDYKVYFHIVGQLTGEREKSEILKPITDNHLESYIILHGAKSGTELDDLFSIADMGIGSLGRHRSGITHIKTLKNREYAARGIPFIYSEIDDDFENMPYILKMSADDSPIDITNLIHFYKSKEWNAQEIRDSIKHLAWKEQMKKVIDGIFNTR